MWHKYRKWRVDFSPFVGSVFWGHSYHRQCIEVNFASRLLSRVSIESAHTGLVHITPMWSTKCPCRCWESYHIHHIKTRLNALKLQPHWVCAARNLLTASTLHLLPVREELCVCICVLECAHASVSASDSQSEKKKKKHRITTLLCN